MTQQLHDELARIGDAAPAGTLATRPDRGGVAAAPAPATGWSRPAPSSRWSPVWAAGCRGATGRRWRRGRRDRGAGRTCGRCPSGWPRRTTTTPGCATRWGATWRSGAGGGRLRHPDGLPVVVGARRRRLPPARPAGVGRPASAPAHQRVEAGASRGLSRRPTARLRLGRAGPPRAAPVPSGIRVVDLATRGPSAPSRSRSTAGRVSVVTDDRLVSGQPLARVARRPGRARGRRPPSAAAPSSPGASRPGRPRPNGCRRVDRTTRRPSPSRTAARSGVLSRGRLLRWDGDVVERRPDGAAAGALEGQRAGQRPPTARRSRRAAGCRATRRRWTSPPGDLVRHRECHADVYPAGAEVRPLGWIDDDASWSARCGPLTAAEPAVRGQPGGGWASRAVSPGEASTYRIVGGQHRGRNRRNNLRAWRST